MSVFATATGVGSWPGTSPRQPAEVVVGELAGSLAHLVELPERGVGADPIGRAGALLVDIFIDTVSRGYRLADRPGAVCRRATSMLDEDLDAFEEAWEVAGLRGSAGTVKVQAPGPLTLAAELELSNGHRAITDSGAVRDLAASLAEGLAVHRATLARRLDAPVVVQLDEPVLAAAVAGRLSGVSSLAPVPAVEENRATALLDACAAAAGAEVALHSRVADLPWNVVQRSAICAVSVDATELGAADYDGIGEFVDSGRTVVLGLVPAVAPQTRPSPEKIAADAVAITDRIGFPGTVFADRIGIAPVSGLASATAPWARTAIGLARRAAEMLADDPDRARGANLRR